MKNLLDKKIQISYFLNIKHWEAQLWTFLQKTDLVLADLIHKRL